MPYGGRHGLRRHYGFRAEPVGRHRLRRCAHRWEGNARHHIVTEGETVAAGEVFGTIEAVKTVSDAFLPVSGEIVEFNAAVDADPSIVNKDPYGEGWLVKVRVSDPAEYDTLLTAEQYTELIG